MRLTAFAPALLMLLAACATAPEPRQYLLEAPTAALSAPTAPISAVSVGLRELALPLYARRQQIPAQGPDGSISATDAYRWAEEPSRAATRLVSRVLGARTGTPIYVEPWPLGTAPEAIVTIEVDRFIGALGGDVTLEGQMVIAGNGDKRARRFAISEAVAGPAHADLAKAYGAALARLADEIIAGL